MNFNYFHMVDRGDGGVDLCLLGPHSSLHVLVDYRGLVVVVFVIGALLWVSVCLYHIEDIIPRLDLVGAKHHEKSVGQKEDGGAQQEHSSPGGQSLL